MKYIYILLFSVLLYCCSHLYFSENHHIDRGGGAYANSPDGQWLALINDGYSKTNDRPYATIELWSLKQHPRLKEGVRARTEKAPILHLEFPQQFMTRDAHCDVTWDSNSKEFSISFDGGPGASSYDQRKLRHFRYNLTTDTYALTSAPSSPSKPIE